MKLVMNKTILTLLMLTGWLFSVAQTNRYVVYFGSKADSNYPYSLESPSDFLTERSIQRRVNQDIPLDSMDLPVNPAYVEDLQTLGIDVYFTSKWLNAALVQTKESNVTTIQELNFVDSVTLVARHAKLSDTKIAVVVPEQFEAPTSINSTTELQNAMTQVDAMHQKGIHGEGMLIGILDNGFDGVNEFEPFEHLWTDNRIIAFKDFVENSGNVFRLGDHGTSVFSTIAGKYGNDFNGVAYAADFVLCITEEGGSEDRVEEYNWLLGAEFADSLGADIINGSLGYNTFDIPEHDYEYEDLDGETTIVSIAAKIASDKGMIVVVSAGNEGDNPPNTWRYITPPADADKILTVGSVDPDFSWTSFSSLGPSSDGRNKPDVSAMGFGTAVVRGNGSITRGNGTSFASPQIAGFAAGVWQENPTWTNIQVIDAIKGAGHRAHSPDTLVGHGVPFYTFAVNGKALSTSDILTDKITVYPNPFDGGKLFLKIDEEIKNPLLIKIIDTEGKTILKDTISITKSKTTIEYTLEDIQEGLYFLSLQYDDDIKVVKLINSQ